MELSTALRILRALARPRNLSIRRTLSVLAMLVAIGAISVVVHGARALDHVLFPRFRREDVDSPIFVIANPRSGTTFMHRLMCLDEERFTYFQLWQTILPSVTLYRLIGAVSAMDRVVGSPLGRLMRFIESRAFAGWDGVHAVGMNRAEEEEFIFLMKLLTPSMLMFFPFPDELRFVDFIDELPDRKRRRLMRFYKESLRRHVYAVGGDRAILSKNVFFGGRMKAIEETFPNARYVHLVRHPYSALPSMMSMFTGPWRFHSPDWGKDSDAYRYWGRLGVDYYKAYLERGDRIHASRFIALTYDELVDDPKATIERVYEQLEIPMSDAFRHRLLQETQKARAYRSSHDYSLEEYGLDRREIYEELREVFERYGFDPMLDADHGTDDLPPSVGDAARAPKEQRQRSGVHGLATA